MIISITGTVIHKGRDYVVVDVGGLGHQVFVNSITMSRTKIGEEVRLWTYEHIREDIHALYGFISKDKHRIYLRLMNVSGVGPKTGLGIMTLGTADEIETIIERGDVAAISSVSGVGKKTAQKIVLELKGKLVATDEGTADVDEVLTALMSLGYSKEDARAALAAETVKTAPSDEEKLRVALRSLGR